MRSLLIPLAAMSFVLFPFYAYSGQVSQSSQKSVEAPAPYGLKVGHTTIEEFKNLVKKNGWVIADQGYRTIKGDIYNKEVAGFLVRGIPLDKLEEAYFWFFKGKLMQIDYRLREDMAKTTFNTYYDLLKNKYGTPAIFQRPQLSDGKAIWKVAGVVIELYCPWVTTTTYLTYTDPYLYEKARKSDEKLYKEATKKKAKSLPGI